MIEILVSLTIVAFGLLGLAGLQARSMSMSKDSVDRKAAAEIAAQFVERARANYDGFRQGHYTLMMAPGEQAGTFVACGNPDDCTPHEIANRDLAQLSAELRRRLPESGAYVVTANDRSNVALTLAWQEGQITDGNADPDCPDNLDVSFRCLTWTMHP